MLLPVTTALLSFAIAVFGQNLLDSVSPCILTCYETHLHPSLCESANNVSDDYLARCTCETFENGDSAGLYNCIHRCSKPDQATYLVAIDVNQAYQSGRNCSLISSCRVRRVVRRVWRRQVHNLQAQLRRQPLQQPALQRLIQWRIIWWLLKEALPHWFSEYWNPRIAYITLMEFETWEWTRLVRRRQTKERMHLTHASMSQCLL